MFWSSGLRDGYGVACLPDEGAFFFWQLQAKRSRKAASACKVFLMFLKLVLYLLILDGALCFRLEQI